MLVRVVVVLVLLGVVLAQGEEQVSVTRGREDIVSVCSSESPCTALACPQNFSSYLVKDRACVEDTTLQRSKL